jgi:hypothetical protein
MKPVFQDKFRTATSRGNCFSACVASILELELKDVPNWVEIGEQSDQPWRILFETWCAKNGIGVVDINWVGKEIPDIYTEAFMIANGIGTRLFESELIRHSVVCQGKHVVHDPHPDGGGLTRIDGFTILFKDKAAAKELHRKWFGE